MEKKKLHYAYGIDNNTSNHKFGNEELNKAFTKAGAVDAYGYIYYEERFAYFIDNDGYMDFVDKVLFKQSLPIMEKFMDCVNVSTLIEKPKCLMVRWENGNIALLKRIDNLAMRKISFLENGNINAEIQPNNMDNLYMSEMYKEYDPEKFDRIWNTIIDSKQLI